MLLLLWCWVMAVQVEDPLVAGQRMLDQGNFLMAEAYLLEAKPDDAHLVTLGRRLAELATGMNAVPEKRAAYQSLLSGSSNQRGAGLIALASLAAHASDWGDFETLASQYLNAFPHNEYHMRLRLIYYLARYTPRSPKTLVLTPQEAAFFDDCRRMGADQTWPVSHAGGLPYFLVHGYRLESKLKDSAPAPTLPASEEDIYFQHLISLRYALNGEDMSAAATEINALNPMDQRLDRADLRVHYFPLLGEYYERQYQSRAAGIVAKNLDQARRKAILPFQLLPERVADVANAFTAATVQEPATMSPPTDPEPLPANVEAAQLTQTETPSSVQVEPATTAMLLPAETPPALPDPGSAEVQASTEPLPAEPVAAEPVPDLAAELESDETVPQEETQPFEEVAVDEEPAPSAEDMEDGAEPIPFTAPDPSESPARPPLLQPGLALMEEGNFLMAEAYFLGLSPGRHDILPLAWALTHMALISGNTRDKCEFYSNYLDRGPQWRGVALFVSAALSARNDDWNAFAEHAADLLREYPVDYDSSRYRLLYYLARYTPVPAVSLSMTPREAAWFGACRNIPATGTWPEGLDADQPARFRFAQFLERKDAFTLPDLAEPAAPEDRYFAVLAAIRQGLNQGDLDAAATRINELTPLDKALDKVEYRVHFLPLLREYFEKRQMPEPAQRVAANFAKIQNHALLAFKTIAPRAGLVRQMLVSATPPAKLSPRPETMPPPAPVTQASPVIADAVVVPEATAPPVGAEEPASSVVGDNALAVESSPEPSVESPAIADLVPPQIDETPGPSGLEPNQPLAVVPVDPVRADMASPEPTQQLAGEEPALASDPLPANTASEPQGLEQLELQLAANPPGLELKLRAQPAETPYDNIYKNYLLGSYYLQHGRLQSAYERLSLAEQLIAGQPFPLLESKVMLAMAGFYQKERNATQANWYRIAAVQLWNDPDLLPIFSPEGSDPVAPYGQLVDVALGDTTAEHALHEILYFGEQGHFFEMRRRAYRQNVLTQNAILGNQLKDIGRQFEALIQELAANPKTVNGPRRFRDTRDLWRQLWDQAFGYYKELTLPNLNDLRATLTQKDRIIAFYEGSHQFGAVIIMPDQAFAVGLGNKRNYLALDEDARLDYLQGRLGHVWAQEGRVLLKTCPLLNNTDFFAQLRSRIADPSRLRGVFSLKSYVSRTTVGDCRGKVLLTNDRDVQTEALAASLAGSDLDWSIIQNAGEAGIASRLENHGHLIYAGKIDPNSTNLVLGDPEKGFSLQELVHYNRDLCRISLISVGYTGWGRFFEQLELINPQHNIAFDLLDRFPEPGAFDDLDSLGIRF